MAVVCWVEFGRALHAFRRPNDSMQLADLWVRLKSDVEMSDVPWARKGWVDKPWGRYLKILRQPLCVRFFS